MSKKVIIIGGGGHARVLRDMLHLLEDICVLGFTDVSRRDDCGIPYLGNDEIVREYLPQEVMLVNGIGSVDIPHPRRRLYEQFKTAGYRFLSLIHPSAVVSQDTVIGEGVQVMAGAIINPGATIGDNTIVNTSASIDHDCCIGNHCHIAPGVVISGAVTIGDNSHIGTGAVIIQGITIKNNVVIGAGSVVVKDIPLGVRAVGTPAKVQKGRNSHD